MSAGVIAQVWNLATAAVTSPLVGMSKVERVDVAVTPDLELATDEMPYLEEPFMPKAWHGFR